MEKLRMLSLFSGIGAFEKALNNIGVDYELVNYCEIDKFASKSYSIIHNVSEELNLKDITKINIFDLPKNIDIITHGSPCFTGDTLVLTNDGYKEIKDIEIGDYVLDHTNNYNKVINFMNQGKKEIWKIKAMGLDELKTTENHKFLVRKKSRVWNKETQSYQRSFSDSKWIRCDELSKDYYLGVAINNNNSLPNWEGVLCTRGKSTYIKNNLKEYFDNPRFWYLCGRYLGDGWTRRRKDRNNNLSGIIICCGKHEDKGFEDKIKGLFNYTKVEDSTTFKYQFPNKELAHFLNQFGKGAMGKFIPSFVFDLPVDLLKGFLDGYFDADGCDINNGKRATSISRKLIYGIAQCVAKAYNAPYSIYKTERPKKHIIEGREVNQNDTYQIAFRNSCNEAFYEDGYIWYPIREVINTHNKDITYDITVENTHSFTANGCIVHNCQSFSSVGTQDGADEGSGTKSSLMWNSVEIIKHCKPKYVIWENVRNVLHKKHIHNFQKYIDVLEEIGYTSYYKVLNAIDYGIPQNRRRIYCISVLGEHKPYEFPEEKELTITLKDLLEENVDKKYNLLKTKDFYINNSFKQEQKGNTFKFRPHVKKNANIAYTLTTKAGSRMDDNYIIDIDLPYEYIEYTNKFLSSNDLLEKINEINNYDIRRLTPLECFRLMGFDDKDYFKLKENKISDTQLYKQAGNSIVVNVLEELFVNLLLKNN
jgi:DNA (cytosine-5)-methyltransferase 1